MYYVSDSYLAEISKEENTPVTLLKIEVGNYWETKDTIESAWTENPDDPDFTISHVTTTYRSYNHSYKISFPGSTSGSDGDYGEISKSIVFDADAEGVRVWFRGTTNVKGKFYAQLLVGGTLKAEKDLYNCRDAWNNYLQSIEAVSGSTTIALRLYLRGSITDQATTIYFDDVEQYIPDDPYYLADCDQDFPYWDVSNYIQGSLPVGSMSSYEQTFTKFPFVVSNSRSGITGEIEGVTVTIPLGDLALLTIVLQNQQILSERVTVINTFWEKRRGAAGADHDCFQKDRYFVDSATADEGKGVMVFDLKSRFAVDKVVVPLQIYDRDFCRHEYKSVQCGYIGTLADCDKTKGGNNGCQVHDNMINFGGQPGIPTSRIHVG